MHEPRAASPVRTTPAAAPVLKLFIAKMKSSPVSRACRVFPAYQSGPAAFYAPRPLAPRRRATRTVEEESPSSYRPRHLCQLMPQVSTLSPAAEAVAVAHAPKVSAFEEPLAIAILLTVLPPVGVPLLWASPRFSTVGKAAVTGFVAFAMLLATIALVAGHAFGR